MNEDLADIKARADRMRRTAAYRSDDGRAADGRFDRHREPASPARAAPPPNVLLDEYWDIYRAAGAMRKWLAAGG